MTLITRIEARTVRLPLDTPTAFSNRLVRDRFYTLVRATGDDGVTGTGFCYVGNVAGSLPAIAVRDLIAPVMVGQDAHRVEGLWAEAYHAMLLHGRAGSAMRALSAVDIALWDRNARAAGLPLHRFLGAYADTSVTAYASGGYYVEGKGPDGVADEMRNHVAAGFTAVKMKMGRLDPGADAERLAAVREAVGPDIIVMLDANNAWSDLPTAMRSMQRWEPYDPYWIEEPFSPDDIDLHAQLAKRTPVLVATGEIESGRWRHQEVLQKHAAAILQTDAAVCGGITEFRRIAAMAAGYGVTVSPHWFHDLHVHLVAATPNARYVEHFSDDQVLNFRRLIDTQLTLRGGQLQLPTAPGLGFDLINEVVDAHAVDAWQ